MKFLFFSAFTFIFAGIHAYIGRRTSQALEIFPKTKKIAIVTISLLGGSYIIHHIFIGFLPYKAVRILAVIGADWMFFLLYFILMLLILDLLRFVNRYFNFLPVKLFFNYPKTKFVIMLIIIFIVTFLYILGCYNFTHPVITKLDVDINNKIGITNINEQKYRTVRKTLNIVVASDIHLGYTISKANLKQYVEMINQQKPDIVFFVGDIVDMSIEPVIEQNMSEELRAIKSKYGIYVVSGNHEHIGSTYRQTMNYYKLSGLNVLEDSVALINNEFYVVGRKDKTDKNRKPTDELVRKLDKSKPIILLDHQPSNLEESVTAGVDLHLSGHTHNGQFFPINLIVNDIYELPFGYTNKGGTHFYVSSGLGLWGPTVRLGSKSELVKINFHYNCFEIGN